MRVSTLLATVAICVCEAATLAMSAVAAAPDAAAPGAATAPDCPAAMSAAEAAGATDVANVWLTGGASPPPGTITAYSGNSAWTGRIMHSVSTNGGTRTSFSVRTGAPLDGLAYTAPSGCAVYAIVVRDVATSRRPADSAAMNVLTDVQTVAAPACAQPYRLPVVTHAVEPQIPPMAQQQRISGRVAIEVALDEHGVVQSERILQSPSVVLNASALDSARRSTYEPMIFRCMPVPGRYVFAVMYSSY